MGDKESSHQEVFEYLLSFVQTVYCQHIIGDSNTLKHTIL